MAVSVPLSYVSHLLLLVVYSYIRNLLYLSDLTTSGLTFLCVTNIVMSNMELFF